MTTNDITGDRIATKLGDAEAQRRFDENFERIFGRAKPNHAPRCAKCGHQIDDSSDYCAECGRPE